MKNEKRNNLVVEAARDYDMSYGKAEKIYNMDPDKFYENMEKEIKRRRHSDEEYEGNGK